MRSWDDKALFGVAGYKPRGSGPSVIPDSHYAAIGKVVDAWADLEFQIDLTIWDILGEEQSLYACLTAQLISVLPKLYALISIVEHLGGHDVVIRTIKKFQGGIGDLVRERNRRIHDRRVIWYEGGNMEVARFEVSAKGRLQFGVVPEKIGELLDIREKIGKKTEEFRRIRAALADALPPSQDRLRVRPFRTRRTKDRPPTPPTGNK